MSPARPDGERKEPVYRTCGESGLTTFSSNLPLVSEAGQKVDVPEPGVSSLPASRGKVYLIGAGPGDPELLTLKGLRCLRMADVVIFDRLVNPSLLDEVPGHAERIFVGKQSGHHLMKQEEINALLVQQAQLGRIVVRLKGGDPFVFGRGGEEALALTEAGIPFEIVPGVTSAIAVPAYAGIPVTHRTHASSVTIVTGHEYRASDVATVNWQALAQTGGTLVIMMGVEALPSIVQKLIHAGLSDETPAAIIQQGTVAQQRSVTATLSTIVEQAREAQITSPAVTVIGSVVELGNSLAWFQTTPSHIHSLQLLQESV